MEKKGNVRHILKGTLYGVVASLALVLVFALVVNLASLSGGTVRIVAQIIKVVSIFYGVMITLKGIEKRGWLFGGVVGILHTILTFFIFSILDGNFDITAGIFTQMLFAIAIGAGSAVLLNMGKNRHA